MPRRGAGSRRRARRRCAGSPAATPSGGDFKLNLARLNGLSLAPLLAIGPFVRPYWLTALAACVALLIAGAVVLSMPFAARLVIDHGFGAASVQMLDDYFLAFFALSGLMAVFGSLRYYLVTWLGERVVADVRQAVYDHILSLDQDFFDRHMSGEVLSRLTADTTLVQASAGVNLSIILRSILTFCGAAILMLVTSPKLTAIVALVIPAVMLPLLIYGRRVRDLSRDTQDRLADTSGIAAETLAAMPTVQAFTLEDLQAKRYQGALKASFDAAVGRIRARAALNAGAILIVFGAVVFVLWLGAQDVVRGQMSLGELGQFLLYAFMVAGSAATLGEMWGELQRAAGAIERVMDLLHTEAAIQSPPVTAAIAQPIAGKVQFDDVSFGYPSRLPQLALKDFSLTIEPGEVVALVGPSGAGKSTVAQLLLRFHDPGDGRICLDGQPIHELDLTTLRANIGVVPQETALFAQSARANIRYGRPDASDADVEAAARAAHAHEFLSTLPDGYETAIGERGARLSSGQRQRIAIARAVLKDPPLLILDEATSALDAQSEQLVQHALSNLMRGRTTLVIAHRLATIQHADRIIVLDQGQIVEQGNHASLTAGGGVYARLAAMQRLDQGLPERDPVGHEIVHE
ncbi:MAG: ABC transporter transmembrane domain-containing protein [Pseudomonadota bacterium]